MAFKIVKLFRKKRDLNPTYYVVQSRFFFKIDDLEIWKSAFQNKSTKTYAYGMTTLIVNILGNFVSTYFVFQIMLLIKPSLIYGKFK